MKNYSATDWLKVQFKGVEISQLGAVVVNFLDEMWGIRNCNRTSLSKVDWSNNTWIEVITDKVMSTVDNSDLTRLVFLAHHMMLRVELKGCGPGYVKLQFHQRRQRERTNDNFNIWCPTIEDHIRLLRKYYSEERNKE